MNRIDDFGKKIGIPSANQFWLRTGLPRATAFRLWRDRSIYPDRSTVETICKALKVQPGDFLIYVPDANAESGWYEGMEEFYDDEDPLLNVDEEADDA